MDSAYQRLLCNHFQNYRKMVFLTGPRQVGKTTLGQKIMNAHWDRGLYLNWDILKDRELILTQELPESLIPPDLDAKTPLVVLDEVHKFSKWKNLIKGYFDQYRDAADFLITGSARLNTFNKSGDSLLGRYFPYRMHPLSVGELCGNYFESDALPKEPKPESVSILQELMIYGGFPEPFYAQSKNMHTRWKKNRKQLLFQEDLRELSNIKEIAQMELMGKLIEEQSGELLNYSSISRKIRVSVDTVRRWMNILDALYFSYRIPPYSTNVSRSLLKEPKVYLWDWSSITSEGARLENLVASHLLKAVHWWADSGIGELELKFIRTKDQEEVDFVMIKEGKPWMLIEVKNNQKSISKSLRKYYERLKPRYAFQLTRHMDFVAMDCFAKPGLYRVPLSTFLSQWV